MERPAKEWWIAVFFALLSVSLVLGQTSITALLPEVDPYFRLGPHVRLVFDARGYLENGDLNQGQIGPSLQFNLRPFEKLKRITVFDLDDIKGMPVVFTNGYRYLPSTTQPAMNRMQPIIMLHIPFRGSILITHRNRADRDWLSKGGSYWTYRNRFAGERRVTIHDYHPGPYASAEFGYQSQFAKWSTTRLFAG